MSSYKVIAPLVVIPADGKTPGNEGDWYGYELAVVPADWNDERCEQLVKEGFLEKLKGKAAKSDAGDDGNPTTVKAILADVGDDKEKAAAALEAENATESPRSSLVEKLEAIVDDEGGGS